MKTPCTLIIALGACLALSAAAHANTPDPFYLELGAGASRTAVDCAGTTRCDNTGSVLRATAGYSFAPNWAAELSLARLGSLEAAGSVPGVGNVVAQARLRSAGLAVAGTLPLSDAWSMTARLGAARVRTTIDGTVSGLASASQSESTTAPTFGVALNFALARSTALTLAVDSTRAEYDGEKATVTTATVGLKLNF